MTNTCLPRSLLFRRLLGIGLLLCICLGSALAQTSRFGTVIIRVAVSPRSIPADNQTRARLRVEVRDTQGRAVRDGTLVVLHTDLGFLTLSGSDRATTVSLSTQGGFVSAWIVSDVPGTALVSINAVDSRTQAYVDFLPPGQTGLVETHIVRIGGGWTAYAYDLHQIEARDKAWARFDKLRLEGADALQLDVQRMILRGGPGQLTDGTHTLQAEDFYLELQSRRGAARVLGSEGVERLTFDLYTLTPRAMDWKPPDDAFTRERATSLTWLKAREITVFSHEKIVFREAALYTQTKRVLNLPPIWIMALPGYSGESNNQIVGLNSTGGVAFRFPWFVAASDVSTDAIQIEKGASASNIAARDEWSLGLVHEYRTGGTSGTLQASGLPYDDWGIRWRDQRLFGNGAQSSLDLASPDHQSLFLDGNFYRSLPGHSLDLRTYYQKPVGFDDTYGASVEWLTDPRRLSRSVSYRVGGSLGVQKGALAGVESSDPQLVTGLSSYFDVACARLGARTYLTPSVSDSFNWYTPGYQTNSLRAELRLDHSFGRSADLSLSYAARHLSGDLVRTGWGQLLSLDARYLQGNRWMLYGSSSLDLTDGDWYTYTTWDYYLSPRWRLSLLGTWYQLQDQKYDDQEIYVGTRLFQDREIGLAWSRRTHRLTVELTGLMTTF